MRRRSLQRMVNGLDGWVWRAECQWTDLQVVNRLLQKKALSHRCRWRVQGRSFLWKVENQRCRSTAFGRRLPSKVLSHPYQ
jgi:hypothetical protein